MFFSLYGQKKSMFVHVEVLKAGAFENIHGDVRYCAKALGTKS